jgi:lantibiotic transport system permease protein
MTELLRAVSAESLKLKRTLALRLAVIAPLFIVLLQLGVYLARGEDVERAATNPAAGFARGIVTLWTLVFLPFWATLAASLCASLDHSGHHWDQLFALPVHRWPVYAAKWIIVFGLVVLSSICLPLFTVAAIEILKQVRMEWRGAALQWGLLLNGVARSCAACLLLISLQCWLSLRWRSFLVALGVGIAGIMSGIILISAPLKFLSLYPWTAAAAAASPREPPLPLIWGMCAGLAIAVFACWRLAIRNRF